MIAGIIFLLTVIPTVLDGLITAYMLMYENL